MKKTILHIALLTSCLCGVGVRQVKAQQTAAQVFRAAGTPQNPKVTVNWTRYYDYDGLTEICAKLAKAYPDLVKLETIGDSYEGRRIWALTISDFTTGDPERKPAMYIDGNIHSNEIQGSEFALYTAWYLVENFQDNKFIQELLQQKTFYILPIINPDARHNFMHQPNTAQASRSGMIPLDDDGDGLVDEDVPDDLNKDGHITFMRRKSSNGRYVVDPQNPLRLIPAKPDQPGEYELLGYEGLDNDSDGLMNEDPPGYYDPSRDWGWNWQPNYIQPGAYKYPFSVPENRSVKDFVLRHPNIAGAQNYHHNGGMALNAQGAEDQNTFTREDNQVYDLLTRNAQQVIPGYTYSVVYKDLNSAFGGELDWFHGARGIFTFSNELMSPFLQLDRKVASGEEREAEQQELNKMLLLTDAFVEWKPFDHPTLGKIEIGGFKKNFPRAHPGFLLEEDAHRNMAFTVYQAYQLPQLVIQEVNTRKLSNGLTEVTATVANNRILPTHSSQDLKHRIERPDYISLRDSTVVSGMVLESAGANRGKEQKLNPARLEIPNVPGMGSVKVRWIVSATKPNLLVEVDSRKGGVVSQRF
ncbi:M14 family metallopeptidase [Rufibacter sediminis]|uniref:Peptidase M14 n=1 Tax=Rufibacter sediminis TaxID=2762756 RepID=A0ABR6VS19_9BACT|nr:M14 family metallopeptidase [Rufibacter sediminis]MBC3539709.1 peptidase M14 [Rufibacter sediminis]